MMRLIPPLLRIVCLVRYIWLLIGSSLLILVIGHYILGGAGQLRDLFAGDSGQSAISSVEPYTRSPVYDGFPDKEEFWREHKRAKRGAGFQPYFHWRRGGFAGKYTNVSPEGVRFTVKNNILPAAKKIFMFGGSTLWGTGSPDESTIPSRLQAFLGAGYDVYNFGETAYVAAQELNYLLYRLSIGDIPDIVIFYDGVNDGYAGAYSPAVPREPQKVREDNAIDNRFLAGLVSLFRKSNYYRFFFASEARKKWDRQVESRIATNSTSVIDMYEAHIKQVKGLSAQYGFQALFFWQPNLFSLNRRPSDYERAIIDHASAVMVKSQKAVYEKAKTRLSGRENENIYFLGDMFDDMDEPVYIDWMHIGPNGNARVARRMFEYLVR